MASGVTIIVGGGVAGIAPFTIGQFTQIVNTDPKAISDGNIRQDTGTPPLVFIGDSTITPKATAIGGGSMNLLAGESVVIGNGAIATYTGAAFTSVVIGKGAKDVSFSGNSVVLGHLADGTGPNGNNVIIGSRAKTSRDNTVTIGNQASTLLATGAVALGSNASALKTNTIAIGFTSTANGNNTIVIGPNASTNFNDNLCIGVGVVNTVASSCILIGHGGFSSIVGLTANTVMLGGSSGVTTFIVGNGTVSGAPSSLLFRLANGSGANIVGGTLTLQPGLGTGNSVPAFVNIQTPVIGGAGAVVQTARVGLRVSSSLVAADTDIMVWDQNNLALARVSVGAAGSGGVGFKLLRIPN